MYFSLERNGVKSDRKGKNMQVKAFFFFNVMCPPFAITSREGQREDMSDDVWKEHLDHY